MKVTPLLFSPPMVRALLNGSKTQTRREVKGFAITMLREFETSFVEHPDNKYSRYGYASDLLYVRETCGGEWDAGGQVGREPDRIIYRADPGQEHKKGWAPSIHMKRKYSRLTLRLTAVRVERLNNISEEDAIAEGIDGPFCAEFTTKAPSRFHLLPAAIHAYAGLWESINGEGSWKTNPWVWVLTFEVIKMNVDVYQQQRRKDDV